MSWPWSWSSRLLLDVSWNSSEVSLIPYTKLVEAAFDIVVCVRVLLVTASCDIGSNSLLDAWVALPMLFKRSWQLPVNSGIQWRSSPSIYRHLCAWPESCLCCGQSKIDERMKEECVPCNAITARFEDLLANVEVLLGGQRRETGHC